MIANHALQTAYRQACEIEIQAFKPGNVSVYSPAHDMSAEDFIKSAAVSAPAICNSDYSLGEKIFYAVQATRQAVHCNTNLGIVLLCAPLIQAYMQRSSEQSLRQSLAQLLSNTTIQDCEWAYRAIMLAAPGGLGESNQQDVANPPEVNLREAMLIASERDRVALQYVTDFKDIFDFAVLEYNQAFVLSENSYWSALVVFTALLARFPDSHIERKFGDQYSSWITDEMNLLYEQLRSKTFDELLPSLYELDSQFKTKKINPGTTADMTVATLLAVFLEQLI